MNGVPPDRCLEGAFALVDGCARVARGEKCYVLADPDTRDVASYVMRACAERTLPVRLDVIEPLGMHGAAPPPFVGPGMLWADVIFCLTRMSLAHSAERLRANEKGARYLSLPDYSLDLLAGESLRFDFARAVPVAWTLKGLLDGACEILVRTPLGTHLRMTAAGRKANACPGVCWEPGTLGSPPDAEVNIAPLEGLAEGVVHVDGSIPCRTIGKLGAPVTLEVRQGAIAAIHGGREAALLERVFEEVGRPAARVLAEFGIGLNPHAQLSGRMLEDEGCAGTIHLGFGSNATIGGRTQVPFHLDFVVRSPSVWVDGVQVLRDGVLDPEGRLLGSARAA